MNLYGFAGGDPVNFSDPFGLCIGDLPCPKGFVNAVAGFGDAASFGLSALVRRITPGGDGVDYGSAAYGAGSVAGMVASTVITAGASTAEAAGEASFFEGTSYSSKVATQMSKGAGEFHSFPESVRAFEKAGTVRAVKGGDGVVRQMLEIPGAYKTPGTPEKAGRWVEGVFQFMKEADGTINHRTFVPK